MTPLAEQFASEIAWYMRERDLTHADVAKRMGVSTGRLARILSGTENLTLDTLDSLTAALGAPAALAFH